MSVSDADWLLLERRLESIERSIEMLKAMQPIPENVSFGTLVEVDKQGNEYYILKEGDLMNPSLKQQWRNKDD